MNKTQIVPTVLKCAIATILPILCISGLAIFLLCAPMPFFIIAACCCLTWQRWSSRCDREGRPSWPPNEKVKRFLDMWWRWAYCKESTYVIPEESHPPGH